MRTWLFLTPLLLMPVAVAAGPEPPCGGGLVDPPFAAPGQPPTLQEWKERELRMEGWEPPGCLGWAGDRTRKVTTLAAEFTAGGAIEQLLARVGAFSAYRTISYWSASRNAWQKLVIAAGLEGGGDLPASAFRAGATYTYFEEDRAGRSMFRLTVRERSADRAVVVLENITPIKIFLGTLFEAGALQSTILIVRRGPDRWGYYHALRAGEGASLLAVNGGASYANRMIALYRYVAGLPSGEPH
jgi:hypothetical protein